MESDNKQKLLRYLEQEMWGELQAYFEVREWEKYYHDVVKLENSSRKVGEVTLADSLHQLAVAAREKNEYYIERHQTEIMEVYGNLLEQIQKTLQEDVACEEKELTGPKAHILFVDDSEDSRKDAEKIFAKNFKLSFANSGEEAFKIVEREIPDLLLIDVYMPDMDGFEMMDLLKKQEKYNAIPVIFLTNDHDSKVEVRGFKAGAQDFIIKPMVAEIAIQRVSHILELSRLQKDLQKEVEKQTKQAEDRRRQVERLSDQIINALAETIDAKDTYTNGHSLRVAGYATEIAKRAGKTKEEQERIYYMGMLHDIGKIGIPDSIITKNSSLSDKEYYVTRKHPEIGAEILATISEIPDLGVGARWHHERYDGTGYPDGLKGMEIPEEARLIAVADAYDAMASKRSYRDVLPQHVIYEEIKKGKGTQFDPEFADIMLQMMDEDTSYQMREK